MKALITYVTDRLREFSTWRGIAAIAATAGAMIAPEQLDAAYKLFVAGLGALAVFAPGKRAA
ncbi:MAG TPA: hypothetical protein VGO52_16545 [Hyphomonadaceae bacterium]|jgi:hypothetical protein|nr:hypothetical protein [Hyphomonadaceae bacterium]